MPAISRFFGIVIFMNYNEHNPPHFHARYQDQEVLIELETGIINGEMNARALGLIMEWYTLHKKELAENWILASQRKQLKEISPLV